MSGSYYNTLGKAGQDLYGSVKMAKNQEELILDFFKNNPGSLYTPPDVHDTIWPPQVDTKRPPITSIRRAITSLTKKGELRKTAVRIMGPEGERNHCWTLNQTP
jgi:hypothetical protein